VLEGCTASEPGRLTGTFTATVCPGVVASRALGRPGPSFVLEEIFRRRVLSRAGRRPGRLRRPGWRRTTACAGRSDDGSSGELRYPAVRNISSTTKTAIRRCRADHCGVLDVAAPRLGVLGGGEQTVDRGEVAAAGQAADVTSNAGRARADHRDVPGRVGVTPRSRQDERVVRHLVQNYRGERAVREG